MGPLVESDSTVTGISNSPIKVKGVTKSLQLKWDGAECSLQLTVLGTLKDVDVILGMDVLSRLDVKVEARNKSTLKGAIFLQTNWKKYF